MTSIMPYGNLDRALRRTWPLDAFDDFFSPLASVSPENVFKMDVEDAGEKYVISAELAGVSRDEIDVELNEGRLSISVNKQESEEEKSKTYLHKETSSWSATRGIYLKDAWRDAFYEGATEKGTFYTPDGEMTVDYMKRKDDGVTIYQGDGYMRYSLPLLRVGRMTFVLPDEGMDFADILGTPEQMHMLLLRIRKVRIRKQQRFLRTACILFLPLSS